MAVYNLTVYETTYLGDNLGYCYIWNETIAGRVAQKLGHAFGNGLKICLEILGMYVCIMICAEVKQCHNDLTLVPLEHSRLERTVFALLN